MAQIYVESFDDRCLGQLEFVFSGAFQYQEVYNWDTCSGTVDGRSKLFLVDVPTDTPHGSTALLSVRVSDSKGQFSAPVARSYTIRDNQGPQIEVLSPAPNSVFDPVKSAKLFSELETQAVLVNFALMVVSRSLYSRFQP